MTFSVYFWLYLVSIAINLVMIFYMIPNRRAGGAAAFIVVLFCCSVWSLTSAAESLFPDAAEKLLWLQIGYPAHTFGPLAWFVMTLRLTEHDQWLERKNLLLLCVIPVVTSVLALTNFHGLMWAGYGLVYQGAYPVLSLRYGVWFWIHMAYATGLDILSVVFTAWYGLRQTPLYAKRYASLMLPVVFVWAVNTPFLLHMGLPVDLTPVAWGAATPPVLWALFRNDLFDLVPIARTRVMESLGAGVVLIDRKNRIVDLNPAAAQIFHCPPDKTVGLGAENILSECPELLRQIAEDRNQAEWKSPDGLCYVSSYYEIKRKKDIIGRMLILRDVTEERRMQAELLETQRQMAVQQERERMARDMHDDMGQIMGFVNVQAQAVQEYLKHGQTDVAQKCLERLSEVAREAHGHVRETILAMQGETAARTTAPEEFKKKLGQELNLFERSSGIRVEKDFQGIEGKSPWNAKAALQISKMVREAFHNIRQHSEADTASVAFAEEDGVLTVTVSDNGCCFDPDKPASGSHFGLLFLRERAEEMGGRLELQSRPDEGTTVKITVPMSVILLGKGDGV